MGVTKSSDVTIKHSLRKFIGREVLVDISIESGINGITIQDTQDSDNRFGTVHTPERELYIMEFLKKEARIK
jgi:hypothetical protein